MTSAPRRYGLIAEFADPEELIAAARGLRARGYQRIDAFTPFPIEGLSEATGFRRTKLPWLVFAGGVIGVVGGFALQYYASAVDYPLNVGGRPLASWPAFGIVAFELCILCAAITCVLGMLAANGLPTPHHPVFNVPEFELASRSRFFLLVESADDLFDDEQTRNDLTSLGATSVQDVER